MKRIKIDNSLIKKVQDFNANLFSDKKVNGKNAFVLPKIGLKRLYKSLIDANQKRYLIKLYCEYEFLLNLKPSEFASKKNEFDAIYNIDGIKSSSSTIFGKNVVDALRYDAYRDSQYPRIVHELGWNLKTCFYCNYAGTITVAKAKTYKAYYDLDHVMPKSMYPFLATSFFNFIPSCASCNRSKSSNVIPELNPFYESGEANIELRKIFEITKKSKIQFYNNLNRDLIQIKVADSINNVCKNELDRVVDLELLYNSQKHEAEEILWKKKIYSDAYLKSIQSSYSELKLKTHEINRILWGTDLNEDTINDRPLAKFKFDLINDK